MDLWIDYFSPGQYTAPYDPCGPLPDNSYNESDLSDNSQISVGYFPATDELRIKYHGNPVPLKISVFNLHLGPVLTKTESGNEFYIPASTMKGFYILTVHSPNQKLIFRKVIYISK
ncbi:MAG: T9SS type A sorting domain-containing protein [Bacteroidales bacterium]